MIQFDATTRTFNIATQRTFYVMHVTREGILMHVGWGIRPKDAPIDSTINGSVAYRQIVSPIGFETQMRSDEVITYGDVSNWHVTLKAEFETLPETMAAGEAPHLPIRDLRLRYTGYDIVDDAEPGLAPEHGLPTRVTTPRQTLRIAMADPVQGLEVTICYRVTPEHDVLERWLEFSNAGRGTVTLDTCNFATMHLPNGTNELTYTSGAWAREFTTQRTLVPQGTHTLEDRSVQTGHYSNPFVLLNRPGHAHEASGIVYFGQLAFSGSWHMAVERLPHFDVRVHGGYNPFDFELKLAVGETHKTPAMICGVCDDGWGGASRRMHAFARDRVLPRSPAKSALRPVLYNSWEATYFDLSYEGQAELAQKAAAMGVELFCLDDGWFGGRRNDWTGLGDWFVSEDVFPEGMEKLVAEVHRLGMEFGLWVEPEMVNPDSDLYRAHPDWVLHFAGRPRTEARGQLILDFGRTEVVDYIYNLLDKLVDRYSVAFFKWDMNRNASEAGSVVGKAIWRKHTAGVYQLMDRLRAKYPTLDIQSCSGGGGRIDAGILYRTDQVWTSDNTDAHDRIRIQEGYSLAYPARAMEAWVTHGDRNHITQRATGLELRFDVAMRGVLGIGSSLNELDSAELAQYASHIAFYKKIRHIVQEGDLYRLERLEEFDASIVQYVLPDGSEAVYSLVVDNQKVGSQRPATPLVGLVNSATYVVADRRNPTVHTATGYELMTMGIPKDTMGYPGYSRTYHVKRIHP